MMKRMRYSLLAILALFTLTVSCVDPLEVVPVNRSSIPDDALVFSPKVLGITPATKTTPGEDNRGENTVTRLDVFVYKTTGGTSTFHKQYTIGDGSAAINLGVDYLLETNWRLNYTTTDTYRIYAIANINANKLNNPVLPTSPAEEQLLALTSESDATITGQYGYTCYDIVRLQNLEGTIPAEAGSLDHHISKKLFLMDGKVDSWQIDQTAQKQYFTNQADKSYPLSRAAAKFRVKLDFSQEFKESLGTADETGLKFTTVIEEQTKLDDAGQPVTDNGVEVKIPKTERIITIGSIIPADATGSYANGVVTGGARAKFANIMKATYDIAPSGTTPSATEQTTFRDANLWDSQNFYEFSYRTPNGTYGTGTNAVQLYKYPYIDTTYSYAFSWDAAQAAEKAPALAVSIVYTTYIQKYKADGSFDGPAESDGGVTNYYRIPLVDITKTGTEAVNEVKRNYYYQVEAFINTMGTSSTEIVPTRVKLNYRVIPWPYDPDEVTDAQTTQLEYFVAETSYRLRGDGAHSTTLQYFTPKSNPLASPYEAFNEYTPKIKNIQVYYNDQDGVKHTLASEANPSNPFIWSTTDGGDVSISVIPARDKKGGGDFHVSSTSLANRSIRYIEFDAYVEFEGGNVVTHHFVVTHFPLDNIQSILGWWSSRWNQQPSQGTTTTYYRKRFYKREETVTPINQQTWAAGIGNNNESRRNASSAATAVNGYYATGGSQTLQSYSYSNNRSILSVTGITWNGRTVTISGTRTRGNGGTNGTWNTSYNNYDYVVSTQVNDPGTNGNTVDVVLWKYNNYYRVDVQETSSYSPTGDDGSWTSYDRVEWEECTQAQYNATSSDNRKMETVKNHPGTGTWVAYSPTAVSGYNQGTTYADGSTYNAGTYGGNPTAGYYAKVWESDRDDSLIHRITSAGGWGREANVGTDDEGKNNPHMYVIQISKAESGVILGRPVINSTTHLSNDNVVSPAFMIASQLGAVSSSSYDASSAATHCFTYMEVSENGRRFVGWRLPTKAEITYIVNYQKNDVIINDGVFAEVLGGDYYYTLDGGSQATGSSHNDGTFVRCIRDLTPAEVIELNETGSITAASY